MKSIRRYLQDVGIAFAAIVMGASVVPEEATAQTQLVYSAKFVCGTRTTDVGVVSGVYETSVNIHNPHFVPVQFRKKAVIALPQRNQRGRISPLKDEALKSDEALGVDCLDIRRLYPTSPPTGFIEGFLVIYIQRQVDVVGVYTARERKGTSSDVAIYDASSIAVERVPPITVQSAPGGAD